MMLLIRYLLFIAFVLFADVTNAENMNKAKVTTADVVVLNRIDDIESIRLLFSFLKDDEINSNAINILNLMLEQYVYDVSYYFKEISVPYVRSSACKLPQNIENEFRQFSFLQSDENKKLRQYIANLKSRCREK